MATTKDDHAMNAPDILHKNFVLKRVGDQLYLPCSESIASAAPSFVGSSSYILCRTSRFLAARGLLLLDAPTSYEVLTEKAYRISIEVNSDLILSSGVKAFEILGGPPRLSHYPIKYERPKLENAEQWTPIGQEDDHEHEYAITPKRPVPSVFSVKEKCRIAVDAFTFGDGKMSFTHFVHPRIGDITFEIVESTSRKEFDAIKEYFIKALRSKVIECQIAVEAVDSEIRSAAASFSKPDLFSAEMIEKVEDLVIQGSILTSEEEIVLVEDKLREIPMLDNENQNLEGLLERMGRTKKSKHYYHLRHLSARHEGDVFRLRMTGNPVSFIFVLKGRAYFHLIWETYETEEATYVWRLMSEDSGARRDEIGELLDKIKWLRMKNKHEYIRSKPRNFARIEHDYSQADGGMQKWTRELDECLY